MQNAGLLCSKRIAVPLFIFYIVSMSKRHVYTHSYYRHPGATLVVYRFSPRTSQPVVSRRISAYFIIIIIILSFFFFQNI